MRGVYIGSYTGEAGGDGVGITLARRDGPAGALRSEAVVARTPAPSFLAWHPGGRTLYAANELDSGTVSAFAVEADGRLRPLGSQPTGGSGPCHLVVHAGHLLTANYVSGDVSVHPVGEAGALGSRTDLVRHSGHGPHPDRQEGPHAHQVRITPDGRHVLVNDLGTDSIHAYLLDPATGTLRPAAVPAGRTRPGAGPRHLVFGPGGTVHVACELDSTVTTFRYQPDGAALTFSEVAPSIVDRGGPGDENYPSEIVIDPAGRFVYLANRGRDVVTTLAVTGGGLRPVADVPAGGRWPRHLALIDGHLYVANQLSHQVTVFGLDPDTGVPYPTGGVLEVPSPACILPAPPDS